MGKKESPKKENNIQPKIAGISNRVFGIIKFILGICLLPFVWATTVSFINEFRLIENLQQNYFWAGLFSFLIVYLVIWEPAILYAKGQKLLELLFGFFRPLVRVAPFLLPVYTIVLFFAYVILSFTLKSPGSINYFIFLFGFSMGLHLVFSSKSMRSKQADFLKANYIFGFSFIYIINIILLTVFLSVIFEKFSLLNFSKSSLQLAKNIFNAVFRQLF
jgi:hypothetical protein